MKPSKSQIVRPSGIVQSKDGRYYFWECVVTKTRTFADEKRFLKLVAQYGSEENLFKTFMCKAAKKAAVGEILASAPTDGASAPKTKKVKASKKVKQVTIDGITTTPDVNEGAPEAPKAKKEVKVEEKPIYPWQSNPNHFGEGKIVPVPANIEELTKDACVYPPRHLDDLCKGCPVYDKCTLSIKYSPEDWNDKEKREARKVKVKRFVYSDLSS
jgi:hypothetical protein